MTGFEIGCWIVVNIILTYVGWLLWSWSNAYLFTYLGDAEICGDWKQCFGYHALTIPARIACFAVGVLGLFIIVTCWASFVGIVVLG